ncbi:hypothetical protein C1645_882679 [Glomus cerebriforme]|uniref:F-box domain-containing protein n=1 Tax=Glomus cerebriforme TaxID=658196 RepID=A0A397RZ08_9GLOM|nr:hypothetical protein C1645_882679 [Glomus cerebriforme]
MSQLNNDILFLIFEELQDDSKSLFSCLLVNRIWCKNAIPILWMNPWRYSINYRNKSYLFAIIASYLPNDIKKFLLSQGIKFCQISKPLLFNYLSFCESFNVNILNEVIISSGTTLDYNQFILQEEFYNVLISTSPMLNYLDIRSISQQIFHFPEVKARLETLYELICDTSIGSVYLYGLARICKNIQKLGIINNTIKVNHGVAKLIEMQEDLKIFEWEDDFEEDYFIDDPYEETLLALEKKADNLNHFKIFFQHVDYEHTVLQEVLPKFYKLKTLIIVDDFIYYFTHQLRMFYIEILCVDFISINTASGIIENSGGHLKKLLLFKLYDYMFETNFNKDSLDYIHKICEHCPSIEFLSLAFPSTKKHFTEFEKLLKVCQNLKSLFINIFNINEFINKVETKNALKIGEELLKLLIRSAPTNLREIRFFNYFRFSLQTLEEFFKQWRGRPALSVLTSDRIYREEDYINLINKYKNEGVIKDFRFVLKDEIY